MKYKKKYFVIWLDKYLIVGNSVMINVINFKFYINFYKNRINGIE